MDSLSIFIIVISVILAVVFKWFLFHKIRHWMERDLVRQLAAGDPERHQALEQARMDMIASGLKPAERQKKLTQLASNGEPD